MERRRYLEESMRSTFQSFGYGEIQTPTFENLEVFTAKSGEAIIDEMYVFRDKGGRQLALRPELTAPVIRFYVEKLQMEPKPLKLFYFGNCFRYDRPQKGRYREFQQAGCEIIGATSPEAIAELITLAYTILTNTGLQHITLNIGNLTIIKSLFTKIGLEKNDQREVLPLIDKLQIDDIETFLLNTGIDPNKAKQFIQLLQTSDIEILREYLKDDEVAQKELDYLASIVKFLKTSFHVKKVQIKMSIVRGLDYYKGVVFEIDAPALGAEKQLCGGGIYDLVQLFGGTDVSTAGFAIGFDRTLLALEVESFEFPTQKLDVFVIPINEEMIQQAITISQKLRETGLKTEFDLLRRGVRKSLKYAHAKNATYVILVGPKEVQAEAFTLRNMKTGKQQTVKLIQLTEKLKKN
jgi:histidyl-tRNA synthetase